MKIKIRVRKGKGAVAATSDPINAPAAVTTVDASINDAFKEGF